MSQILPIAQIIVSVLLIIAVLLQNRGGGLGSAFGGGGASFHTKRGFERSLFISTIVLGVIFVTLTILALVV
jgi:protein translocase SecG subunit